ncbi:Mitochondrial phosphate carrier protein [Hypsizygus marmoreus]|uniref:Mitochondrial phosphate carrier protein n=1 Tax=Hypsizygus marmoreus TaxID=39966 RepID=A0A369JBN6_HYPMA|nr:Mitochondrial phosphate carrier protein [Hypsizygus marmoreus]
MSTMPDKSGRPFFIPKFSAHDYQSFFLAGAICCTLSHAAMTPIDVVKTRIQIDPAFKGLGFLSGTRQLIAKESLAALLTGIGPTAVGYLVQGGTKFAGYELWKKTFVEIAGDQETAVRYRTAIYLGAASVAEFFADILLTPLEATRIRLVSQRGYATGLVTGFTRLAREGGIREIYAGFLPILCKSVTRPSSTIPNLRILVLISTFNFRQIPYAIGQFAVNEFCHELVYRNMSEETRRGLTGSTKFGIALGNGIIAGFAAAILSQPADTLLSQINKGHGPTGSMAYRLTTLAREAGFRGLFAGLGPRMIMTAGLVSSQFLMYGAVKNALGAPAGLDIHKERAMR